MTDSLRTRIIAAVARELVQQARDCGEYQTRDCNALADAVIRELNQPECGGCRDLGGHSPRCHTTEGTPYE